MISLPSVVLIVAQASSGGGRIKEERYGEAGGGVEHGLSDRSGVEKAGERSGVPTVGVPHVYGLEGGVLRESRSILVLSRVRTFISRSRSMTSACP